MTDDEAKKVTGTEEVMIIGKATTIEAPDKHLLLQLGVQNIDVLKNEDGDNYIVGIIAEAFKKVLKPNIDMSFLKDARFYILVEMPNNCFRNEINLTCKEKDGMFFAVTNDPVKHTFNSFVPIIRDRGSDNE